MGGRVAAFYACGRLFFLCFIWHCPWRGFVSECFGWRLGFSGRSLCWVATSWVFLRFVLTYFFSTFSHCAWRHFISFSNGEKETEAKKTPLHQWLLSVPSVQFRTVWYFRNTLSAKPRTVETLPLRQQIPTRFATSVGSRRIGIGFALNHTQTKGLAIQVPLYFVLARDHWWRSVWM